MASCTSDKSPHNKKKEVVQELATKILKIKLPYFHNKKGRPRKGLTSVEEDWLVEFFEHPGITR